MKEKNIDTLVIAMGPNRKDPSYPALKETYASIMTAARAYGDKLHVFFVGGAGTGTFFIDTALVFTHRIHFAPPIAVVVHFPRRFRWWQGRLEGL